MSALAGRSALVTGAGIGIGQAIAIELARQGAAVALHYASSAQGAQEAVAEIERFGGKAIAVSGKLGEVSTCRRIVDEAAEAFGGLDILVNNAGITHAMSFLKTSEEIYNEVFDLNMRGYYFCTQQAVTYMLKRGRGSIVNITSVHGAAGFPRHSAYAATKGAIIAFTRELAVELAGQHIRVNAVGPGLIEVPRYFDIPGYTNEFGGSLVPYGRAGQPQDIAPAVAFLASDAADFITGQVLYIDGGTTAKMALDWDETAQGE
ncbi:SDR family NAD(P)-dependent oxidoreductase [Tengunoibacter tsumagoiensis]|uniref:3-ketoacyl-ACP reductase n=1 Tax=Tengunoibacter tsumagoiensis TaxID=2014871 RepID=A0A402A3I5_9CHLR|nr:3-oxoacyl-ACP reductase family protein [Tengunoibacter tsumagoiensis]GCE13704.1 3-ketoacyl-ACP reductase [Tengunoibacter tsumagoiensis]